MAGLVTLCGAFLGFVCALSGYLVFDIGFLTAFAIWAFSGPVAAMIAMFLPEESAAGRASAETGHAGSLSGSAESA